MEAVRLCGRCGGEMSAPGYLYSAVRLSFRPQDAKFMTFQTGDVMTKALMCQSCGTIEVVGDVRKLRHLISSPSAAGQDE